MNQPETKSKDVYWQWIRGISILCVVLIHCQNGSAFRNADIGSWNFDYWLVLRQIINFAVAMFIFLSGYFVKIETSRQFNFEFIMRRVKRLLIPFLIWSTIYTVIKLVSDDGHINIMRNLSNIIFGLSSGQLYFIVVLIQLTLLTPLLIYLIEHKKTASLLFLVTPIYLIGLYVYTIFTHRQLPNYQTLFPAWFIFYYFGLWVKIKGYKPIFKTHSLAKSAVLSFLTLILSILEGYLLLSFRLPVGFASSQIKFSTFIYTFSLINLFMVIKLWLEGKEHKGLIYLGDHSYGIFYIHVIFIIISRRLMPHVPLIGGILPLYHLGQLLFVVTCSLLSIIITRRIIGKKLSGQLLGF